MDKIGPITRSVEDAALVFAAIHGYDGRDPTAHDWPFRWPVQIDLQRLRIGYTKSPEKTDPAPRDDLRILEQLGCELVEIQLPAVAGQGLLNQIIDIEAASVFDAMLRAGDTEGWNAWPRIFRASQFVSAVDFLRLQRQRRRLMFAMEELMESIDVLVNTDDLLITNLTGHPSVVLPQGYQADENGKQRPYSTLFTGRLNDEERLLALALAYQSRISAHLEHPPLDPVAADKAAEGRRENSQ